MITWRSLPYAPGRDLVKGTELAVGFVDGLGHRFGIYETRTREADGMPGLIFKVRDAHGSTDADLREGKQPPIVFTTEDPAEAERWCRSQP